MHDILPPERRWIYAHSQWPIKVPEHVWIQELNHESWSIRDAEKDSDVVHVQSAQALASVSPRFSRTGVPKPLLKACPQVHGSMDSAQGCFRCHQTLEAVEKVRRERQVRPMFG